MRKDPDTGLAPQPLPEVPTLPSGDDLSGTVVVPGAREGAADEVSEVTGSVGDPLPLPGVVRSPVERESSLAPLPIARPAPRGGLVVGVVGIGCALGLAFAGLALVGAGLTFLR